MALKICPLGSGSKGNAVYIKSGKHSFLIDCGLPVTNIKNGLADINSSLNEISGILITHEHIDHIRSAGILAEGYGIPIYAHEQTFKALNKKYPKIKNAATFKTFAGFSLCGLHIIPFLNPHDVFTVGYSIADEDSRIVYATDLGYVTPTLLEIAKKADLVMLESNYDACMLKSGRYPYYLKRRIASEMGHLSNDECA
ncbi:MAG: MBL fold metallo-hydrolase, partial [Clostridia bacterium]